MDSSDDTHLKQDARHRSAIRHPVVIVALIATAVRLWLMTDLPLIITNDGAWYLQWAKEYYAGRAASLSPLRTPGYPLFLAGMFEVFGVSPFAVLVGQHALGIATSAMIASAVARKRGTRWGLAAGLFAALSPSLVCWECYALTESLAIFLILAALVQALAHRGSAGRGLALGLTLGLGCLVRPSIELLVPFFCLGWLWRRRGWRNRGAGAAAIACGLILTTGPWLAYNAHRGIYGLAGGGRAAFWWGMYMAGALDNGYPLPPAIERAYAPLRSSPPSEDASFRFLAETDAWRRQDVATVLAAWSRASISSNPRTYLSGAAGILAYHLGLRSGPDSPWFLSRFSQDGRRSGGPAGNMQITGDGAGIEEFRMNPGQGAPARAALWLSRRWAPALPQLPLFAGALIVGLAMLTHRDWGGAMIVAGTLALFMLHPVMLLPSARLAVPAWVCWIVFAPEAVNDVRRFWFRSRK